MNKGNERKEVYIEGTSESYAYVSVIPQRSQTSIELWNTNLVKLSSSID